VNKKELINYFDIQWENDEQDFHLLSDGVVQKKIDYTDNIKHNVQLSIYNFLSEIK